MRNARSLIFIILSLFVLVRFSQADKFPLPDFNLKKGNQTSPIELDADQINYNAIQEATAEGHVYLDTQQEQVIAQKLVYNFHNQTGVFHDARVFADPYQIKGQTISKISATHIVMQDGYMTTCDFDEPHFRIAARRTDIYQKDRVVMHDVKVYMGKYPVAYLPYFSHSLNHSIFTFIPGQSKEFGFFLLTRTRLEPSPHVKLTLRLDAYERTGFGEGLDTSYRTPNFGQGLLIVYYTLEKMIAEHHRWSRIRGPAGHHERFRVRWRHRWEIDKNTNVIWQVYKIHDYDILNTDGQGFVQNYFPHDAYSNADVNTYVLLTKVMPHGTLTINYTNTRINRQLSGVDSLPEIIYTMNAREIGHTGFYFKSTDTYSNLTSHTFPKGVVTKTERMDTNNDLSHPFKIGFIAFNPHVGGENTYYSRTADLQKKDIIRGVFRTSLDMSTKFYKLWRNFNTDVAGLNIHALRHVITPTITYLYQAKPTFPPTSLNQFTGAIDDLYRIHQIEFGLENKLQTKRDGRTTNLLRMLLTTDFGLPTTTGQRGFNPLDVTTDFYPTNWLTIHDENEYDTKRNHFNFENASATIHTDNWSFSIANLFTRSFSDQLSTQFIWHINPKWSLTVFDTFPLTHPEPGPVYSQANISPVSNLTGVTETDTATITARQHEIVITRDLHEWQMDFYVDAFEKEGVTLYIVFRLKIFPHMKFSLGGTTLYDANHSTMQSTNSPGTTYSSVLPNTVSR